MCARFVVGGCLFVTLTVSMCPTLGAQGAAPAVAQATGLSMTGAVLMALERNQALRAQRLTVDASKADAVTASIKPNPNFSFTAAGLSAFSPAQFTLGTSSSAVAYDAGLTYTFERGGKRDKRMTVAQDAIDVAAKGVLDAERQVRFQTEQAFINVLLAKSTLEGTRQDLKTFSDFVELNQQRVKSGDLAEGDFLPIAIQKLQFETDVSAAEVGLVQAKAALRQLVGFDGVSEDFEVTGDLAYAAPAVSQDDLKREALISRPDLLGAQSALKAAQHAADLERGNGARSIDGSIDYLRTTASNALGLGIAFELPFNDHNQGNIERADIGVRQAIEMEAATRYLVLTDVASAFAAFQASAKVVKLYESGYLDQARQSLDITLFAFQRGASSLLNVLDAERTYRDVQLNYRQALATLMTNARQINFVVGKQVVQ